MKTYHLKQTQTLPITIEEAWEFFSSPMNLPKITPSHLAFKILSDSGGLGRMYAGQIISYKVNVFPGLAVNWVTEITHVDRLNYFVDEQRLGPYALWHHQHHFKPVNGGVEMTDEVTYAIPLGWLGRLAHFLFVERQLRNIFEYRFGVLKNYFFQAKTEITIS